MRGKAVDYQHVNAMRHLDTLLRGAKGEANVATIVGGCAKSDYLRGTSRAVGTGTFLGGTTIAGFRTGRRWEFWYQSWGQVNGGAIGITEVRQFLQRVRRPNSSASARPRPLWRAATHQRGLIVSPMSRDHHKTGAFSRSGANSAETRDNLKT